MKTIKINFSDFFPEFEKKNNFISNILTKKYIIELSDNPDYLFFSVTGSNFLNYKNSIRIFYTGENQTPDFNLCDYAIGFDYMTFEDRYFRHPTYFNHFHDSNFALNKHSITKIDALNKKKFCNFIYSNSDTQPERKLIFDLLSAYNEVDSGGRYLNNLGFIVDNKFEFQLQYKFSIAFENTSTNGYTTEKILQAFSAKTIPIYWGNPKIAQEFNPKAFINCHDYNNFDDVLKRVKEIDSSNELFYSILQEPTFITPEKLTQQQSDFENFLFHIFDQEKEQAFRRQRFFWGRLYEEKQKRILLPLHTFFWEKIMKKLKKRFSSKNT